MAIDADKSGAVTFAELKRACFKLNWPGDVRLLFKCLDTDDKLEDHKKTLSLDEVNFLESWQFEPTEEEMQAEEAARAPPKPKPQTAEQRRATASAADRLSNQGSSFVAMPAEGATSEQERPSTSQSMPVQRYSPCLLPLQTAPVSTPSPEAFSVEQERPSTSQALSKPK